MNATLACERKMWYVLGTTAVSQYCGLLDMSIVQKIVHNLPTSSAKAAATDMPKHGLLAFSKQGINASDNAVPGNLSNLSMRLAPYTLGCVGTRLPDHTSLPLHYSILQRQC